ncbi:MAG: phosphoribosylformylglycinamidine cyclo-ligase [Planctomycetaceae bacterium]
MPLTYKDAGLDLDLYDQAIDKLPALMQRTHSPRVMPLKDGFAGLFRLFDGSHRYEDPVLVSGTDGVGTKIRVAQLASKYDTIGIDLVAMCVNDCLCVGAEPLFFLDYLAMDRDDPDRHTPIVAGVSEGCSRAGLALIGGETAIMPGLYAPGDFDLAGFCVGVVERKHVIDGSAIRPGDALIGIPSSGLHSNGYSLVRKVIFEHAGLRINSFVPELDAAVCDVLLTPTRIYSSVVAASLSAERDALTGIAHITGGGLADNIARLLPAGTGVEIDVGSWTEPPVFGWLASLGAVERAEMFRVFNMGIGLVLICRPAARDGLLARLRDAGEQPVEIGRVVTGDQQAHLLGM